MVCRDDRIDLAELVLIKTTVTALSQSAKLQT